MAGDECVDFRVFAGVGVGDDTSDCACPGLDWANDGIVGLVHSNRFVAFVVLLVLEGDADVVGLVKERG